MPTVVHVTHEAIQKIGGIGAVLHGLFTSPVYLDSIQRNILVGPFWPMDTTGEQRLGPQGEVLYSSLDRKSTRLNSSHTVISYAVFCLKKKKKKINDDKAVLDTKAYHNTA